MLRLTAALLLLALAPSRAYADEPSGEEPEPDDIDFSDEPSEKSLNFQDEDVQGAVKPRGPGEDTADLYRKQQEKARDMTPEEELLAWERYLEKYPSSLFKERIEARVEDLSASLFRERVPGSDKGATHKDAALRELNFSRPVQWASLDPRSRVTAGVELGLPDWFAPRADYEHALKRNFSFHVGAQKELANFALAGGAKYALLKSARTGTIVTGGADLKLYTSPAFVDLHPWVGVGQRIDVLEGLDLQAQVGMDIEARSPFSPRYEAGFAAELRATSVVSAFVETSADFKYPGGIPYEGTGGADMTTPSGYRFVVATFGLRFQAAKPRNDDGDGRLDVGLGANLPASANYWGFYQGAATIDGDWRL